MSSNNSNKKGAPTGFYLFWIASMVGIVLISVLFFYMGFSSLQEGNTNDAILNIVMGVAGMGIAVKVAYDMAKARLAYQEEHQEIFTELHCTNCGRKMLRTFKEGDFVGKLSTDDKCPKCGSSMLIVSIFAKTPKQKAKEKALQ
ncbi:MAG: hypothetical protein QI197_04885 [Candidatus Korarchaeota archaeon]|nr:hypothetical protein [Candidatus Korarchaeota archaeon]MDK2384585.1 hypothetical protein [Candidatus Korarchaeota archaeon]